MDALLVKLWILLFELAGTRSYHDAVQPELSLADKFQAVCHLLVLWHALPGDAAMQVLSLH
jgi:hypothetical protein